tara:strand:- start:10240 stop:11406 length:1167 start_codon:yes stop_codon:yes gene_type:complete
MICDRLARCGEAQIVSGFATPDGIEALRARSYSNKITRFVLGAGTFKAFEALDDLLTSGLPPNAARVHLGHTRATGGRKNPFARLRPMLHSKVYYFEMPDGKAAAFVGSHNLTGFAMRGLNGEAAVLLEGETSDTVFDEIRAHVAESYRQAVAYDTSLKEAYALWFREYLEGLRIETSDMPRDDESRRTVILFAKAPAGRIPSEGDRVYFELDLRITDVKAIDTEVHLHLFETMPANPAEALSRSSQSDTALLGKVEAIDSAAGSAEVRADWFIDDPSNPELKPAVAPFRPILSPGKQQVRAEISEDLMTRFDYLFDSGRGKWVPTLGNETVVEEGTDLVWSRVEGLREQESGEVGQQMMLADLREISPESGSFVLFSRRRRKLGTRE